MADVISPSPPRTTSLLDLPPEVLAIVVWKLSPVSLARFSQACRVLHNYVESLGQLVWKDMFLRDWDDPRLADEAIMAIRAPEFFASPLISTSDEQLSPLSNLSSIESKREGKRPAADGAEFRWRDEVRRRIETATFLARFGQSFNEGTDELSARRTNSLLTVLSTLATTPPASHGFTSSKNVAWVERLLSPGRFNPNFIVRHFLHDPDTKQSLTPERQLTAKFQVHFFSPRHLLTSSKAQLSRLNARAYVYNIRNYRQEGWHGPWVLEDGLMQPNWIHLAACQRVIMENLTQRQMVGHTYPAPPTGPEATWGQGAKAMATARKANPSRVNENGFNDWAGVEGIWRRLVCFMDYRDFHEYNVHGQRTSGGLDTSIFKQKHFNEATRIITMTLKITRSEPSDPPFEHRPRLWFEGVSVANDTMISVVHGFVCMTDSGYVRWHLVTRYDTDDRWVTEAIGDAGSAAGFIGTWTGNHHEPDDPAGPTWLWKVADVSEIPSEERRRGMGYEGWVFPDVFFNNGFGFAESDDDDEDDDEGEENHSDDDMELEVYSEGDSEEGGDEDDESSSSDGTGYALPSTIPPLQPLSSLYD